jgi:hypothetical protein
MICIRINYFIQNFLDTLCINFAYNILTTDKTKDILAVLNEK